MTLAAVTELYLSAGRFNPGTVDTFLCGGRRADGQVLRKLCTGPLRGKLGHD